MIEKFPDQFLLPCTDIDSTIEAVKDLGFRLEMIMPADSPTTAIISKNECFVRLESTSGGFSSGSVLSLLGVEDPNTRLKERRFNKRPFSLEIMPISEGSNMVFSRSADSASWERGRAGMLYRDLIPGRLGGAVIASEIKICEGGPVNDYVHYHDVHFQMIFCKSGWVRVVYEDQGEPFVLNPGDCVLQPPNIRHRVIESSDNLEVIEVSSPAIHPTFVEHEITLPSEKVNESRLFNGQRFSRFICDQTEWSPFKGGLTKDTGIGGATDGAADVRLIKSESESQRHLFHSSKLLFWYVLKGELQISGFPSLKEGDSVTLPAEESVDLTYLNGCELLEVRIM